MKQLKNKIDTKNEAKKERNYFTVWFNFWKYENLMIQFQN